VYGESHEVARSQDSFGTTNKMTEANPEMNVEVQKKDEWWAAFPEPRASVPQVTGDEVMKMFDEMDVKPEPRPFLLVDVRRTDWEVRGTDSFSCILGVIQGEYVLEWA
jgi:hypothetical protein